MLRPMLRLTVVDEHFSSMLLNTDKKYLLKDGSVSRKIVQL
eukprot:XP_001705835.1 Hypothetical protein GL50803_23651 [Giardia lamblia ATCC 50803]